jgi:hypothetical protein
VVMKPDGRIISDKAALSDLVLSKETDFIFWFEHFENVKMNILENAKLTKIALCAENGNILMEYPLDISFIKGDTFTLDFKHFNILFSEFIS